MSGLSSDEIERSLEPARPRDVVIRMLNNLKALHISQEEWEQAWRVQLRLYALYTQAYEQRRDLALIASKTNRPGVAVDLLQTCLKDCSPGDRTTILNHLRIAENNLSRWN